jgi:hypothetical protein
VRRGIIRDMSGGLFKPLGNVWGNKKPRGRRKPHLAPDGILAAGDSRVGALKRASRTCRLGPPDLPGAVMRFHVLKGGRT